MTAACLLYRLRAGVGGLGARSEVSTLVPEVTIKASPKVVRRYTPGVRVAGRLARIE